MFRRHDPLPDETEKYISDAIDAAMLVHRNLGPGFIERAYQNAMCLELSASGIPFETEKMFVVKYHERPIATHRVDLIVGGQVILELKAVAALEEIHGAQVMSYLRATGLRAGLLMNFGGVTLKAGLRRIVI